MNEVNVAAEPVLNNTLVETRGLVKAYRRRRVVNGVHMNVRPGEIVGLLGPNGADVYKRQRIWHAGGGRAAARFHD